MITPLSGLHLDAKSMAMHAAQHCLTNVAHKWLCPKDVVSAGHVACGIAGGENSRRVSYDQGASIRVSSHLQA